MAVTKSNLGVVWHIGGEFLLHDLVCFLGLSSRAESHGAANGGGGTEHVSSGDDGRKSLGSSDGEIRSPHVVQVKL